MSIYTSHHSQIGVWPREQLKLARTTEVAANMISDNPSLHTGEYRNFMTRVGASLPEVLASA